MVVPSGMLMSISMGTAVKHEPIQESSDGVYSQHNNSMNEECNVM